MPLPYTKLIHEKLSVILTFAFSAEPIESWLKKYFHGDFKFLYKTVNEIGSFNALSAFVELAAFLRLLDDADKLSSQNAGEIGITDFGRIVKKDGTVDRLNLRDMTNKIIHAKTWRWDVKNLEGPKLICVPNDPEGWAAAEVDISSLAAFCGTLAH
jgi:hypothetical protein